jgi:hypothetical protein
LFGFRKLAGLALTSTTFRCLLNLDHSAKECPGFLTAVDDSSFTGPPPEFRDGSECEL